jgi:hypothetical protein
MKTLRGLFSFLGALARELSDERAYARHLEFTKRSHSTAEWKAFSDGRHRRKYQNAKCC